MTDNLGTVVIDEKVWPIDRLHLGRGGLNLDVVIPRGVDFSAGETGQWMVFGPDGEQLFMGVMGPVGGKHPGSEWRLTLTITFDNKLGTRAEELLMPLRFPEHQHRGRAELWNCGHLIDEPEDEFCHYCGYPRYTAMDGGSG